MLGPWIGSLKHWKRNIPCVSAPPHLILPSSFYGLSGPLSTLSLILKQWLFKMQNLLITIWNNPASGGPASQLGGFYFLPLASSLPNIGNHYMTERPLCVEFSTYNQQYSHIKPLLAGCILFNNMAGEVGLNFM